MPVICLVIYLRRSGKPYMHCIVYMYPLEGTELYFNAGSLPSETGRCMVEYIAYWGGFIDLKALLFVWDFLKYVLELWSFISCMGSLPLCWTIVDAYWLQMLTEMFRK